MSAIRNFYASKTNLILRVPTCNLVVSIAVVADSVLPGNELRDRHGFLSVDVKENTVGVINSKSTDSLTVSDRHRSSLID